MKLATICPPSSPMFVSDVEGLIRRGGHEVRRFGDTPDEICAAGNWADVVWCSWAGAHVAMACAYLKPQTPLIVRALGYEVWEPAFLSIDWRRVSLLVYACPAHYVSMLARCPAIAGVPTLQTTGSLDFDRFPLQPHAPGPRIAMMGIKDARKGLPAALHILADLPDDFTLTVAGECEDGRLWGYVQHTLDALGIRDRVEFVGRVAYEDTPAFWARADWCLVPSTSDQGPRSAFEAMACGVPALVHNFAGAADRFPSEVIWQHGQEAEVMLSSEYPVSPEFCREWVMSRMHPDIVGPRIVAAVERVIR